MYVHLYRQTLFTWTSYKLKEHKRAFHVNFICLKKLWVYLFNEVEAIRILLCYRIASLYLTDLVYSSDMIKYWKENILKILPCAKRSNNERAIITPIITNISSSEKSNQKPKAEEIENWMSNKCLYLIFRFHCHHQFKRHYFGIDMDCNICWLVYKGT